MLACICAALSSPDAYNLYLMLKTEQQRAIFCVIQMYTLFLAIASILVYFIGGAIAATIFFVLYFCLFGYCLKTAIPMD